MNFFIPGGWENRTPKVVGGDVRPYAFVQKYCLSKYFSVITEIYDEQRLME